MNKTRTQSLMEKKLCGTLFVVRKTWERRDNGRNLAFASLIKTIDTLLEDSQRQDNEIISIPCPRCKGELKAWESRKLPSCGDCLTEKEAEKWFDSPPLVEAILQHDDIAPSLEDFDAQIQF